jgi:hypothetical protein
MNTESVLRLLEAAIRRHGSVTAFAESIGVTPPYISAVRRNTKAPSTKILDALGLEIVDAVYRRKPQGEDHG